LVGVTYSRFLSSSGMGNAYICTPQRILQAQYEQSFDPSYLASLYGKSNYPCANRNVTCDIGSLLKPPCRDCPHEAAKANARRSPNTVFNYTLALLTFSYLESFKPRKLIVLDECHTLEDHLTEFSAAEITERRCKRYHIDWKRSETLESARLWLENVYLVKIKNVVITMRDEVEELMERSHLSSGEMNKVREFNSLEEHYEELCTIVALPPEYLTKMYVLVHDKTFIKFKPLTGAYNFKTILEPMAEKFLFMSSTVLNYKGFCNDLGIDSSKAAFLSLGSEFEPDKRPVYFMPQMKMNAAWNNDENAVGRRKMLNATREILEAHENESGIIHTANFALSRWLVEHLGTIKTHDIWHHNPESGDDRNKVIKAFQQSKKPAILISPSITEGLDLVGDKARFAIFAKVPFGYLGDQWIKARMDLSTEWYQRQAVIDVIQGGGRIVRSTEDWGHVYILDASWAYLFSQVKQCVPQWWLDAYHVMSY
jgi:ATP-dependent DNA helicase DinG